MDADGPSPTGLGLYYVCPIRFAGSYSRIVLNIDDGAERPSVVVGVTVAVTVMTGVVLTIIVKWLSSDLDTGLRLGTGTGRSEPWTVGHSVWQLTECLSLTLPLTGPCHADASRLRQPRCPKV